MIFFDEYSVLKNAIPNGCENIKMNVPIVVNFFTNSAVTAADFTRSVFYFLKYCNECFYDLHFIPFGGT